ncbi:DNA-binding protein [Mycena metata]|uniref:DNA-binding protein n=1 Tax=Mycena metata TaxID=1033252 RepID=A0AAD7KLK5_9AGAR|nr:DNA-binding protein [Mycena metata]
MANSQPLTFNQAVRGITEFIEVAIHTIIYVRQIYPADLFIRRKKYDTPVFQSRHPALNDYISGAVKAIGEQLLTGNVEKIVVAIKDKEEVALERFIFSIDNMIQVEGFNTNTSVENALSSAALGQYFRGFLVKLNMVESQLGQMYLGDDVSFSIAIELKADNVPGTKDKARLPYGGHILLSNTFGQNPPPWIPAYTQHTTSGASEDAEMHLIRAVNTGILDLSLAVQESDVKLRREREALRRGRPGIAKPPPPKGENTLGKDGEQLAVSNPDESHVDKPTNRSKPSVSFVDPAEVSMKE